MLEPLIMDGEDLYEDEDILAERILRNKRQVLCVLYPELPTLQF